MVKRSSSLFWYLLLWAAGGALVLLLGRLFSAERGGGLISVAYAVRGRTDDPAISVNPLSALTPGFLRGLFKIFD